MSNDTDSQSATDWLPMSHNPVNWQEVSLETIRQLSVKRNATFRNSPKNAISFLHSESVFPLPSKLTVIHVLCNNIYPVAEERLTTIRMITIRSYCGGHSTRAIQSVFETRDEYSYKQLLLSNWKNVPPTQWTCLFVDSTIHSVQNLNSAAHVATSLDENRRLWRWPHRRKPAHENSIWRLPCLDHFLRRISPSDGLYYWAACVSSDVIRNVRVALRDVSF